jgi:hypothetical protein
VAYLRDIFFDLEKENRLVTALNLRLDPYNPSTLSKVTRTS